jgi:hypothetical protein
MATGVTMSGLLRGSSRCGDTVVLSPSSIQVICSEEVVATESEPTTTIAADGSVPRAAAITFATTQHFVRRIARLRAYYFDNAPELMPCLLSVPPADIFAADEGPV